MVAESQTLSVRDFPAYLHFTPRPDQPERFDEQTAFYESNGDGVAWMIGGNGAGCLAAEQEVFDPKEGKYRKVSEINSDFHVIARNKYGHAVVAEAEQPQIYGTESLYAITLSNGHLLRATMGHRLLTLQGWREIGDIVRDGVRLSRQFSQHSQQVHDASGGVTQSADHIAVDPQSDNSTDRRCGVCLEDQAASTYPDREIHALHPEHATDLSFARLLTCQKAFQQCVSHSSRRPLDSQGCYCRDLHPCDAQPHLESGSGLASLLRRVDEAERSHSRQKKDDQACRRGHIRDGQHARHLSKIRCVRPAHHAHEEPCSASAPCLPPCWMGNNSNQFSRSNSPATLPTTEDQQSLEEICQNYTDPSLLQWATASEIQACLILPGETGYNAAYITAIEFIRRDAYWDFHVPEYENYWMSGVWNHNTTTTLLAKVARFIYETPPPRPDTPFWVIAKSYDQVTKTCWKEKLYGQGHILDKDVDWARVGWYKSKQRLPYSVPLKPNERGNNWMLEFRSYEQGIGAMMAQAIGGFAFVEQFPWGVFEEVLRGCREYNFPGSKLVEYTPVDPDLSIDIEEMIENGPEPEEGKQPGLRYMPRNWKIFHANTMCAMEAGHVDKKWFEEFFGMVPEDMRDVRMLGMFASFEGIVYKEFSTAVHCLTDREIWSRSIGCDQRRGIDWGAGPENDFVCLWGSRNNLGQWFITDEYVSNDQTRTTVDHLSEVYNRWEWPLDNPRYGVTYCDPADPDNLRIAQKLSQYNPKVENMSIYRGRNAKTEGIEHIKYLLKPQVPVPVHDEKGYPVIDEETGKVKIRMEPKLFIHRTNCPKLIQQMKTYRYLRAPKATRVTLNPRDPAAEPIKKNDHCLDALRYMVLTDDIMNKATISSAKSHSELIAQTNGEYLPSRGLRGFTTQHRNRG